MNISGEQERYLKPNYMAGPNKKDKYLSCLPCKIFGVIFEVD